MAGTTDHTMVELMVQPLDDGTVYLQVVTSAGMMDVRMDGSWVETKAWE